MPNLKAKIVILPGIDGRPELREGVAAILRNRFEVQVPALPEDASLDYPALTQHFMDQLPEGPLLLAGESFSGPLVALIAEKCPDRVLGVAFIASFPKLAIPRVAGSLLGLIPLRAIPFWLVSWVMMGRSGAGDMHRRMHQCLRLLPDILVKHRVRLALEIDVRETIRRLRQPVLVMHGKNDRLLRHGYARQFLDLRPDAYVVMIDGYHMILETNPESVAEALGAFADHFPTS